MFGAKRLRMKPVLAMRAPAMVTGRQPYLFVKALAMGPVKIRKNTNSIYCAQ